MKTKVEFSQKAWLWVHPSTPSCIANLHEQKRPETNTRWKQIPVLVTVTSLPAKRKGK